jgi:hypothetical protein
VRLDNRLLDVLLPNLPQMLLPVMRMLAVLRPNLGLGLLIPRRHDTELIRQRLQKPGQLTTHLVMQRTQPAKLVFSGLLTLTDRLLRLDPLLLSPRGRLMVQLISLPAHLGEHPLGLITSSTGLLTDLPLPFVQLNLPLGRLLIQRRGAMDQRLLHLVPVRLGILASTLQQRGRLASGAGTDIRRFLLGGTQQLLHPITKTLLRTTVTLLVELLELGTGRTQLTFCPVGPTMLTLMGLLQLGYLPDQRLVLVLQVGELAHQRLLRLLKLGDLGYQHPNMVIDLLSIIPATHKIKDDGLPWIGG